jgi:hypothetical protein
MAKAEIQEFAEKSKREGKRSRSAVINEQAHGQNISTDKCLYALSGKVGLNHWYDIQAAVEILSGKD